MTDPRRWTLPASDEVHVWWLDLRAPSGASDAILSPPERARAARFHRQIDRARWTRTHIAVRCILAGYLGLPPQDVEYASDPESEGMRTRIAKPTLASDPRLRFSLAHAADRAALAVAWEREVGIDLEPIDPDLDLRSLLSIACSSVEAASVEAQPPPDRVARFLELWTAKEAYLKAIGLGLFRDPRMLEIEFRPDRRAVVHDAHDPDAASRCGVRFLDAGPGWAAALAVEGAPGGADLSVAGPVRCTALMSDMAAPSAPPDNTLVIGC